jgi:hypothetical protein
LRAVLQVACGIRTKIVHLCEKNVIYIDAGCWVPDKVRKFEC